MPTMSTIASIAPTSWNATSSRRMPCTLPLGDGERVEDRAARGCARRAGAAGARGARGSRVVAMLVRCSRRRDRDDALRASGRARADAREPDAGSYVDDRTSVAAIPERTRRLELEPVAAELERRRAPPRRPRAAPRVDERADRHVAGDPRERVEIGDPHVRPRRRSRARRRARCAARPRRRTPEQAVVVRHGAELLEVGVEADERAHQEHAVPGRLEDAVLEADRRRPASRGRPSRTRADRSRRSS